MVSFTWTLKNKTNEQTEDQSCEYREELGGCQRGRVGDGQKVKELKRCGPVQSSEVTGTSCAAGECSQRYCDGVAGDRW